MQQANKATYLVVILLLPGLIMLVGADKSSESQIEDSELKHAAELWLPLTPNTITTSELRAPSGIIPLAYTAFDPLEDMIPGSNEGDNLDYLESGLVVVQLHTKMLAY